MSIPPFYYCDDPSERQDFVFVVTNHSLGLVVFVDFDTFFCSRFASLMLTKDAGEPLSKIKTKLLVPALTLNK